MKMFAASRFGRWRNEPKRNAILSRLLCIARVSLLDDIQIEGAFMSDCFYKLPSSEDELIYRMLRTANEALDTWGPELQTVVAIEECSELIHALCRFKRFPDEQDTRYRVEDEIADVLIAVSSIVKVFDIQEIKSRIRYKLERLEFRIKMAREEKDNG